VLIQLGDLVRDKVTRFEGVAIGRKDYLYCSPEIWIQPTTCKEDGLPMEPVYFDEARVELVTSRNLAGFKW
jgi:hypothetical protein